MREVIEMEQGRREERLTASILQREGSPLQSTQAFFTKTCHCVLKNKTKLRKDPLSQIAPYQVFQTLG